MDIVLVTHKRTENEIQNVLYHLLNAKGDMSNGFEYSFRSIFAIVVVVDDDC